jgi:hypothetical protein
MPSELNFPVIIIHHDNPIVPCPHEGIFNTQVESQVQQKTAKPTCPDMYIQTVQSIANKL